MRTQQIDLLGGYYSDPDRDWAAQDVVNWIPVVAESQGTLTRIKLSTPPGLRFWQRVGEGPIRGMHNAEGRLFVVSGDGLYQVATGTEPQYLGKIPGVGRVQMAHNQITGGNQLLVTNGQGGGGYVWNTVTKTFAKITDEAYPGSRSVSYTDSYLLQVEPFGRYWFFSNLADALDYSSLDRAESEAAPDKIVALAVNQYEVVVFNETTTEFFYNTGQATGTFQNKRILIERGCASGETVVKLDNSLFWLGDDGVVYRLDGYNAVPVSNSAVQRAFRSNNWAQAFAFKWESEQSKVYYLTFPDGQTWGYDVVSKLWHRRESFEMNRWRITHAIKYGRAWYAGDFQDGRIWEIDAEYFLEGNLPIISERTSPVYFADQNEVSIPYVELLMECGQGPGTLQDLPVITGDFGNGMVGFQSPPFAYGVSGGFPDYTFSLAAGSLPPGISMSASGELSGIPTQDGNFSWTIRVVDRDGFMDTHQDSSTIFMSSSQLIELTQFVGNGVAPRNIGSIATDGAGFAICCASSGVVGSIAGVIGNQSVKGTINLGTSALSTSGPLSFGNGVTWPSVAGFNQSAVNYIQYLMRSERGFMTVINYVGTGANQAVPHGLGQTPGAVCVFALAATVSPMYHRSAGPSIRAVFGGNFGAEQSATQAWGNTSPDINTFTVGADNSVNAAGTQYMAACFAHDEGSFGLVKCGDYTGNGSVSGPRVELGWRPRLILFMPSVRNASVPPCSIDDVTSAMFTGAELPLNLGSQTAPVSIELLSVDSTGFTISSSSGRLNTNGRSYRYIAFRGEG